MEMNAVDRLWHYIDTIATPQKQYIEIQAKIEAHKMAAALLTTTADPPPRVLAPAAKKADTK